VPPGFRSDSARSVIAAKEPFARRERTVRRQSSHWWVDRHVPTEQPPQSIVPPHPFGPEPHSQCNVEHVPQTHAWFTHALPESVHVPQVFC
jgi:hypothetical protein